MEIYTGNLMSGLQIKTFAKSDPEFWVEVHPDYENEGPKLVRFPLVALRQFASRAVEEAGLRGDGRPGDCVAEAGSRSNL